MPKPKTKEELLALSQKNYQKLNDLINAFSPEEREKPFPEGTLNRNIRDVLAHLHQWHLMMLNWYEVGMSGTKPDMPAKGYTWRTTTALNKKIWEDCQTIDLDLIRERLDNSYTKIQEIIQEHSDKDLFEKKKYAWTGSTSLGAYLISASSSHYDWAFKLIKKAKR